MGVKSPKRINILVWILLNGSFNCSATLQAKLQAHYLSSTICPYAWQIARIYDSCYLIDLILPVVGRNYLHYLISIGF